MASKPTAWQVSEGRRFYSCDDATTKLPADNYDLRSSHSAGVYLQRAPLKTDDLEAIDPVSKDVLKEIQNFWEKKEKFNKLGMLWKMGIFFYGPPGGGKTSLVNLISQWVVENDGISIYVEYPNMVADALKTIRDIEPDRPILLVMEDLDDMFREFSESTVLNILDGEAQVDNVIVLATANRPERLEKRVLNRPGRFDLVLRIGLPKADARREYIISKVPEMEGTSELDQWVRDTKGLSIAHLRNLVSSVHAMGHPYEDALTRLQNMNVSEPSSDDEDDEEDRAPFGFARGMKEQEEGKEIDTKKLDLEVRRRVRRDYIIVEEPSIMVEDNDGFDND